MSAESFERSVKFGHSGWSGDGIWGERGIISLGTRICIYNIFVCSIYHFGNVASKSLTLLEGHTGYGRSPLYLHCNGASPLACLSAHDTRNMRRSGRISSSA